jgi:hypothetical protein
MLLDVLMTLTVVQGDAGVLPANPVPPFLIASGGAIAASSRLASLYHNPANASAARGVELTINTYPRTGLRGFSAVAVGGRRLSLFVGLWSYSVEDIFDPDLIAQDPSLSTLGLSMAAGSVGTAFRIGNASMGATFTARTQNIVGTNVTASSTSIGARLQVGTIEVGTAVTDVALGGKETAASPRPVVVVGLAGSKRLMGSSTQLELNARHSYDARRWDFCISPRLVLGPFEVVLGYSASDGWSGGVGLRHQRFRLEAATTFVGAQRLDQRVAVSINIR